MIRRGGSRVLTSRRAPKTGARPPRFSRGTDSCRNVIASRVRVSPTDIVRHGQGQANPVTGDPYNNHVFQNDNAALTFLELINTGIVTAYALVKANVSTDGLSVVDELVTIPAGKTEYAGCFSNSTFSQNTGLDIFVNVSTNALTIRAYQVTAGAS